MPATYDDRLNGINTAVAIKPPCVVRTTGNITLSGTQTIDGVAVVADDRVLVVAQSTASENGVYVCSSGAWTRAEDFDGAGDVVKGTLVTVLGGTTLGSDIIWKVTTANPIVVGTTNLTIAAMALAAPLSYGTMADQNATAVNIDGGAIDGTIIGANSAAAITGTLITGNRFVPNSSTIPTDGMYLPATYNLGFAVNGALAFRIKHLNTGAATGVGFFPGKDSTNQNPEFYVDDPTGLLNRGISFRGVGNWFHAFHGTDTTPAKVALYEQETNGQQHIKLAAPDAITTTYSFTFPAVLGAANTVLYHSGSGIMQFAFVGALGSITFTDVSYGIVLKRGSNARCGTFVANGATPVTVSNTSVAITDAIIISLNTVGGTVGVQPHVETITAATGFTVVCTAGDTSTYNYTLIGNAA